MVVKTYSLKKDGNKQLSKNFRVKEFACPGTDVVLIDDALIVFLQAIRDHWNKPVLISSGYRAPAYNSSISGAKASQHMYGKAADIRITGVTPREIAEFAETLNPGGLGLYEYSTSAGKSGFVHVDSRATRARWLQTSPTGGEVGVSGFYPKAAQDKPTLRNGSKGDAVKQLQARLNALGYNCGVVDGIFGAKTLAAVKAFQKAKKLVVDGIVGAKTWGAIG